MEQSHSNLKQATQVRRFEDKARVWAFSKKTGPTFMNRKIMSRAAFSDLATELRTKWNTLHKYTEQECDKQHGKDQCIFIYGTFYVPFGGVTSSNETGILSWTFFSGSGS